MASDRLDTPVGASAHVYSPETRQIILNDIKAIESEDKCGSKSYLGMREV